MTTPTVLPSPSLDAAAEPPASDQREAEPEGTPVLARPPGLLKRHPALAAWLPGIVLALVVTGVHVWLGRHMRVPIIHADEYGYLMGAHFMAEGGVATGMPYYPGYSLLLVPLWWISPHAGTVYHWALYVNDGLAGVTTLLLYALARRLAPAAGMVSVIASVVAVAAFPSLLMYSNLAESENLLVPGLLAVLLLFWRAIEVPTTKRWATVGVATGLLFAVHGRGLAVAGAFGLALIWLLRPWRAWWRCTVAGLAGVVIALGVSVVWIHLVTKPTAGLQLTSFQPNNPGALSQLLSGPGLEHFGVILAGQALYLMAAAGALVAFGVAGFVAKVRHPSSGLRRSGLAAMTLLALGAGAVVAAVFLDKGVRLDDVIYGRYVEVFAVPVMLAGGLALSSIGGWRGPIRLPGQWRDTALVLGITFAVVLVAALATIAFAGSSVRGAVVRTNVFSASDLFFDTAHPRLVLPVVAAVALGGILVVALIWRASVLLGVLAAVAIYLPATTNAYSAVVDQSAGAQRAQTIPNAIAAVTSHFPGLKCVAWDDDLDDAWAFFNTKLFDPDVTFPVIMSSKSQAVPCRSGLVVADRSFGSKAPYTDARAVAWGNGEEILWVMPGPSQFVLGQSGWLLPAGFPSALPISAHYGTLRPAAGSGTNVSVAQHGLTAVTLQLGHAADGAPWPDAVSLGAVPQYAVRLALAWYPAGTASSVEANSSPTGVPLAAGRADLAEPLLPGRSEDVVVLIDPKALGSTPTQPRYLAPGSYDLEVSVIQESVGAWDATLHPLWLRVTVNPA